MATKQNDSALAADIDVTKVRAGQRRVEKNGDILYDIVNREVEKYCYPLEDYMKHIRDVLSDVKNPPTDEELDEWTLNLPNLLFFVGQGLEAIGIKRDMAEAIRVELFSEAYEKANQGKATIADRTAAAELATQEEFLVKSAYDRAYKKTKSQLEAGNEMLQSVKKVMSRRISEYEMARVDPGRIGGRK